MTEGQVLGLSLVPFNQWVDKEFFFFLDKEFIHSVSSSVQWEINHPSGSQWGTKTRMHKETTKCKVRQAYYACFSSFIEKISLQDLISQFGVSLSNLWQQNMHLGIMTLPRLGLGLSISNRAVISLLWFAIPGGNQKWEKIVELLSGKNQGFALQNDLSHLMSKLLVLITVLVGSQSYLWGTNIS